MKKNFKRTMAAVMAAALTLSLAGTAAEADAAKKIKFASKSVTVNVKKTKTVKIKNVKAKQVKKLAVKSANKKIATVSKKGKTAVKVKGKKAGNTKVTATLTIKGQKKKTKLTLKVKVKKATPTVTQAPATQAPATQAPAVTQAPASQAPATEVPATKAPDGPATDTPPTKVPPTKRPPWTPEPDKKVSNVSITYDYEFPGNRVVKFDGTVVGHSDESDAETYENAKAVGYPEGGIDVRYYDKVVVKYKGEADLTGDGSWFGKATLSSTDDGLGMNEYSDGLYLKYLNDIGRNSDGIYVVEYTIDQSGNGMVDGFDFEDVGLVDCISVQMANTEEDFKGFKLLSADFITNSPAEPDKTDEPSKTEEPEVKAPKVDVVLGKGTLAVGETTTVEVKVPENVTIKETKLSVKDSSIADLKDGVVTAKSKGETTIDGAVTVEVSGKEFKVDVTAALKVVGKDDLVVNVTVESPDIEMTVGDTADIKAAVSVELGGQEVEDAEVTAVWSLEGEAATVETAGLEATVTGVKAGEATLTLTVTAKSGDKTETAKKVIAITVNEAPVVERVFTDFGDATVKYEFEKLFTSTTTVVGIDLTDEQKAKFAALSDSDNIVIKTNVANVTDKTDQGLQVALIDGSTVHMCYVGNINGDSDTVTIPVSNLASDQYGTSAITPSAVKRIELRVAWGGTFDGDVELTSIKIGDNEEDTFSDVKSDKKTITGLNQWSPLGIVYHIPSDVDMTKYSKVRVEATITDSDVALNANLAGDGCGQYGVACGIVNGVAEIEIPAGVKAESTYEVNIGTAAAGFNGTCELTKITLVP